MGYEELHAAWLAFRRHKKPSRSIDEFAYYLEANLRLLVQDIGQHTYRHGTYQTVVVHEKKRRDLAVASVRDRVVHRLVYDELVRYSILHWTLMFGRVGQRRSFTAVLSELRVC